MKASLESQSIIIFIKKAAFINFLLSDHIYICISHKQPVPISKPIWRSTKSDSIINTACNKKYSEPRTLHKSTSLLSCSLFDCSLPFGRCPDLSVFSRECILSKDCKLLRVQPRRKLSCLTFFLVFMASLLNCIKKIRDTQTAKLLVSFLPNHRYYFFSWKCATLPRAITHLHQMFSLQTCAWSSFRTYGGHGELETVKCQKNRLFNIWFFLQYYSFPVLVTSLGSWSYTTVLPYSQEKRKPVSPLFLWMLLADQI